MAYREKLRGTTESIYQIGIRGCQWKYGDTDATTVLALESRDKDDAAYCRVRGADPANDRDLVTLAYFNSNNAAATGITSATITVGTSSLTSVGTIPANAFIVETRLIIDTPYSATATIAAALTAGASLMATGDNDPQEATGEIFAVSQDTAVGVAVKTVAITITNTPGAGASRFQIFYTTPVDITT